MSEENSTENPLILIDGSSYLYRAYHALPPLMSSKNQPTGAIRGVISMINKILLDHPRSPLAVIFDAKGKTFRHEMYKDYKANRPPMPEDLVAQIEPINQIIEALGIKLLSIKGVEADDVIGTLAKEASEASLDTIISKLYIFPQTELTLIVSINTFGFGLQVMAINPLHYYHRLHDKLRIFEIFLFLTGYLQRL